ncbi:MAG TPA: MarR family transcriptional regulator [Actinokineospora sp.]|jgi:DNA-binding MarR family transcriptional regulator|nr:MarR family transcriptional regulator [Actinokineospora sp.]
MSMEPPASKDTAALRAWRDATFYRLLLRASTAERVATLDGLRERGYTDVSQADTALLANLDAGGTTMSALARRTGVTRQAVSKQVALLQQEGYVDREPDPADSRAVLVLRTGKGEQLLRDALDIVAAIEADYRAHLGAERADELKKLLADLLRLSDPGGGLGHD